MKTQKVTVAQPAPARDAQSCDDMLSHEVVVRSLRRRLWQALQDEDADEATKVYTASKLDYMEWIALEEAQARAERRAREEEKARQKKEKREARPAALKKLGCMVQSTRQSLKGVECYAKPEGMENGRRASWKRKKEDGSFSSSVSGSSRLLSEQLQAARLLDTGVGVLQQELRPSEPFTEDDMRNLQDDFSEKRAAPAAAEKPTVPRKIKLRRSRQVQPRLAGFFGRFGSSDRQEVTSSPLPEDEDSEDRSLVDTTMTTPLHEAARLGSGSLVRLMLSHGGDPNLKNGQMRTALHMAAGGLTQEEEGLLLGKYNAEKQQLQNVGLQSISGHEKVPLGPGVGIQRKEEKSDKSDELSSNEDHPAGAKKAARVVGRFFKSLGKTQESEEVPVLEEEPEKPLAILDINKLNRLCSDRIDAVLALLAWCHPDDGGPRANEGPSINSVDARGRTALHYASELGRTEICMAVLNSFGAILTLVDESGQTPCELAGEHTHDALASQLEARALLCSDPYGMDDEFMESVLAVSKLSALGDHINEGEDESSPMSDATKRARVLRGALLSQVMPPFSWFETWSMQEVQVERNRRVKDTLQRLRTVLANKQLENEMNDLMFSHAGVNDSMDGSTVEETQGDSAKTTSDDKNAKTTCKPEDHKCGSVEHEIGQGGDTNVFRDHENLSGRNTEGKQAGSDSKMAQHASQNEMVSTVPVEDDGKDTAVERRPTEQLPSKSDPGKSESPVKLVDTCANQEPRIRTGNLKMEDASEQEVWAAFLPEGIETNERFTIGLDGRDIQVRCPPNLQPGQMIRFVIEEEPLDSSDDTKIRLVEDTPSQKANGQGTSSCYDDENDTKQKHIHESHAERLLTFHSWKVEQAVNAFREDPENALTDAGVTVQLEPADGEEKPDTAPHDAMCLICFENIASSSPEWTSLQGCEHGFCTECMAEYIADAAQSKSYGVCIDCPHHECSALLRQDELKKLASTPAVYNSLLQAADENFVATADSFRFCPYPGCDCVVKCLVSGFAKDHSKREIYMMGLIGAVCRTAPANVCDTENTAFTYEGILDHNYESMKLCQPKKAHRFCFECGEDQHWPVECGALEKWKARIEEEVGTLEDDEVDGQQNIDDVAQRLWMKANTRPCPQCKAPIEKNDGCNHMTCTNRHCRHEFCWICRKDWKLHNTETGGFFRCNRWQAEGDHEFYDEPPIPQPAATDTPADGENSQTQMNLNDQSYGTAIHSARAAWKKSKVMARFLHHYRRWTAHNESAALERRMADTVSTRLAPVVEAAIDFSGLPDFNFGGKGLSFVHAAFTELLECRSVLQHSYAFAFFRYPTFYYLHEQRMMKKKEREKANFEHVQSQLEMVTEQLSDIVARSHLRATQTQIMFLTKGAAEKRLEFTIMMINFLGKVEEDSLGDSVSPATTRPSPFSGPTRFELGDIPHRLPTLPTIRALPPHMEAAENQIPIARDLLTPVHSDDLDEDDLDRLDEEAVRRALQASMQEFMEQAEPTHDLIDSAAMETDQWNDWPCSVCTYMNAGGSFCAMCGSLRS